jgi:hypothetical protein
VITPVDACRLAGATLGRAQAFTHAATNIIIAISLVCLFIAKFKSGTP